MGPVLKGAQCRERWLQDDTAACARPSGPSSELSAGHRAAVQLRVLGLDVVSRRDGPARGDRNSAALGLAIFHTTHVLRCVRCLAPAMDHGKRLYQACTQPLHAGMPRSAFDS